MPQKTQQELHELIGQFNIYGDYLVGIPFGSGHVNDTYMLTYDQGGVRLNYVLQRINSNVFSDPVKVMENVDRVTSHILHKIRLEHAETKKRTIRLLRTPDNKPYVFDKNGSCWRAYVFIERARAYDVLENPEQAYRIAQAFGEFQHRLNDLPGGRLHDTIPDFHNTPKRIEQLEEAIRQNPRDRVKDISREIDFILSRKDEAGTLLRLNQEGAIPERITHNDTKCNNILIDDLSGEGICVIDLDTVMPGLALYDFGDMVRSGTNPADEDELDLSKVQMRFDMYEALFDGFCSSAEFMTEAERESLALSGKIITLEIGTRFLTDYINGDVYFKTKRPHHNLERCRTQLRLVQSIEEQMNRMMALLKK